MTRTFTLAEQIVDYAHSLAHHQHISKLELFQQVHFAVTRELNRLQASDPDRNK